METPIDADLKNYNEAYADKDEKEIIASQITLYVRAIKKNEKILIKHGHLSNIIGYCFCAIVVLILFATLSILII